MSHLVGTAIYKKNVPPAERVLRSIAAVALTVAALSTTKPWLEVALLASAATALLTGVFGFCPACYLVGRDLGRRGQA